MLNFKVGKTYKDFLGKEWEFCSYCSIQNYPYRFKDKHGDIKSFKEYTDSLVTEWDDGTGIRILFVEEKERDWVIGEEYECYNVICRKIIKAKLKNIDKTARCQTYCFEFNDDIYWFFGKGEIVSNDHYLVFKNGMPQELKDRINKEKLTNRQKCFQKGKVYKNEYGMEFKFRKRMKTKIGVLAIFEMINGDIMSYKLFRLNNVECIPNHNTGRVYMCADESIKGEPSNKAVRVMQ